MWEVCGVLVDGSAGEFKHHSSFEDALSDFLIRHKSVKYRRVFFSYVPCDE